jgi:hypothetical protein
MFILFLHKQAIVTRRSTVLCPSLQQEFPGFGMRFEYLTSHNRIGLKSLPVANTLAYLVPSLVTEEWFKTWTPEAPFVDQKLILSSSFRCGQTHKCLMFLSHFIVLLKSGLDFQQTHLWLTKHNGLFVLAPPTTTQNHLASRSIPSTT